MRIGVTGHRQLPQDAVPFVQAGIAEVLGLAREELVGVTSLAEGADQLFGSAVLENGGALHVIVPCEGYEDTFSDAGARRAFLELLARAASVERLNYSHPSENAFLDAGRRVADCSDLLLAIWDGHEARGKGGTGDIVSYARMRGREVRVIWPREVTR